MRFSQTHLHKDTTLTAVGCKVATPIKRCAAQVGLQGLVTDTSMNHNNHMKRHMKRFDHFLWLCRMARSTGFFLRKKSGEFCEKILLAHEWQSFHSVPAPAGFIRQPPEPSSSILHVLILPRQSLQTVCFLMFALSAAWPVLQFALLCPPRPVSSA